jgi:hypothetical protein
MERKWIIKSHMEVELAGKWEGNRKTSIEARDYEGVSYSCNQTIWEKEMEDINVETHVYIFSNQILEHQTWLVRSLLRKKMIHMLQWNLSASTYCWPIYQLWNQSLRENEGNGNKLAWQSQVKVQNNVRELNYNVKINKTWITLTIKRVCNACMYIQVSCILWSSRNTSKATSSIHCSLMLQEKTNRKNYPLSLYT